MTREQIDAYSEAMRNGSIPDDKNPLCLFQGVDTLLLVKIVNQAFDVVELAKHELQNRGLHQNEKWNGLTIAERIYKREHQLKTAAGIKARKRGRSI